MTGLRTKDRTNHWYNLSEKLGCGGAGTEAAKTLDCLKLKDTKTIVDATKPTGDGKSTVDGHGPVIDEKTIFSDYRTRAKAGQFIKRVGLLVNLIISIDCFEAMLTNSLKAPAGWQQRQRSKDEYLPPT
jgi:hypothetical protein